VVAIKLYIEGGSEGPLFDAWFREAWANFFKAAGLSGRMPRVIRGRGRKRTYDLFRTAVANRAPDTFSLLLVDSEEAVDPNHSEWQHLKHRDGWNRPENAGDDDAFLMVQVMETWFLADRDALNRYFGQHFNENAFAQWPELESIPKTRVLDALKQATIRCKTRYTKGRVSFELLSALDPSKVERACPHAQRLLNRLRSR